MYRLLFVIICLFAGLIFAAAPWFMPFEMCAESCPDWLSVSGFIFYIATPLAWLISGLIISRSTVSRNHRIIVLITIAMVSVVALALFVGFAYLNK